jgi:predicted RNase H-like HicB family nuclease
VAEKLVSGFSTTVGGKLYSGSVEESGGEYTASVPSLAGASATGSSIAAAENNLNNRINELV